MKLNLGCNKHFLKGYVNVDLATAADVTADVYHLPFSQVDEIYAGHLLEHLAYPIDFILGCWRVLRPGGQLGLVIPDVARMTEHVEGILFGFWLNEDGEPDPSNPESLHRSWWTEEGLVSVVGACGFRFTGRIDRWRDPRLVAGAGWQSGADFVRAEQNPLVTLAASIHRRLR